MSQDKIQMPSSGGGIVRYSDEVRSKFEMKPQIVVAILVIVIILGLVLRFMTK
ncbi:MAG: preprotein translocase subunit Sec61beta [Candidatus Nanoarchaeia archaeon]|nr:preprotein translocase subunit Sec61beta [Candidatus Nanoarchaeia archaeon]